MGCIQVVCVLNVNFSVGLIAWYSGRYTGWRAPQEKSGPHLLPMEEEYVNFGDAWKSDINSFVAPAHGYYIISYR